MNVPDRPSDARRATMRAADADRERVAAMLRDNFEAGRLTLEEFQERIERVYAARTFGELDQEMVDLPTEHHPTQQPPPSAGRHVDAWRTLALRFLVISVFFIAIWAFSGRQGSFWPIWPILIFGFILALRSVGPARRQRPHRRDRQRR
jgi:Domain of unknown function (DUF1707)